MQRKRVFPNNNLTECRQTYRERDRDGRHTERGTGTAERQREGNIGGNQLMEHTRRQQRDKQKQRKRCRKHENLPQTRRTKNKIEHKQCSYFVDVVVVEVAAAVLWFVAIYKVVVVVVIAVALLDR